MSRKRLVGAAAFSVAAIVSLTAALAHTTPAPNLPTALLLFLGVVAGSALIGGFVAGVATAIASFPVINWFLTQPLHTFRIDGGEDTAALIVFFFISVMFSALVDRLAKQQADARVLRDREADLTRAAASAEIAAEGDRLRTAILRAVSHDLRTPLASIKASASSLLQEDIDWPPDVEKEFITTINEEADRLDRIVGNLLDLSRLDAGVVRPELHPVDLRHAVLNAVNGLGDEGAAIVVAPIDHSLIVDADGPLLERVIANLASNAVRHGLRPDSVEINVARKGSSTEVDIIDHGPGMSASDRERAVEPFQRLGDRSAGAGTGLGLAVARGFIDAMNGELLLSDTPGGGLTATIRLRASTFSPTTSERDGSERWQRS